MPPRKNLQRRLNKQIDALRETLTNFQQVLCDDLEQIIQTTLQTVVQAQQQQQQVLPSHGDPPFHEGEDDNDESPFEADDERPYQAEGDLKNEIYGAPIFDVYDDEESIYDVYVSNETVPVFDYFAKDDQVHEKRFVVNVILSDGEYHLTNQSSFLQSEDLYKEISGPPVYDVYDDEAFETIIKEKLETDVVYVLVPGSCTVYEFNHAKGYDDILKIHEHEEVVLMDIMEQITSRASMNNKDLNISSLEGNMEYKKTKLYFHEMCLVDGWKRKVLKVKKYYQWKKRKKKKIHPN